jgi:outer membrane protein OmpU
MKKALLGTSALVAAGLAAHPAAAASALKLGMTGFYRGAAGVVIGGNSAGPFPTVSGGTGGAGDFDRTSGGFREEIRINFTGQTTLDNGLTVSVLVGLNGSNLINVGSTDTPAYNSYVDFKGPYGDLRFGEFDSAVKEACVFDPGNYTWNFGINSPNESFMNGGRGVAISGGKVAATTVGVAPFGSIGTCYGVQYRATTIAYFSPSFGGFNFGASFTPSGNTRNPGGGYFYGTDLKNAAAGDVLSVGFDYDQSFSGGYSVLIGGGGEWAFESHTTGDASNPDKPSTYLLGFQIGLPGGLNIGASGEYTRHYALAGYAATDATIGDDGWVLALGGNYTIKKLTIGLQGLYSQWGTSRHSGTGHDTIWGVSLNGTYDLGSGVSLEGQIAYEKYDPNDNGAPPGVDRQPVQYGAAEIDAGFVVTF